MTRFKPRAAEARRAVRTLRAFTGGGVSTAALAAALGGLLAPALAHATEWKVGVELPLTGPLAQAGTEMSRGIQVAADRFNRRHPQDKAQRNAATELALTELKALEVAKALATGPRLLLLDEVFRDPEVARSYTGEAAHA